MNSLVKGGLKMGCSSLIFKLCSALPLLFLFIVINSDNAYSQDVCAGYALNENSGDVTQEGPVGVMNFTATANQSGDCRPGVNTQNIATFDGPSFDPPPMPPFQTAQLGSRCADNDFANWGNNYLEFCIEAEPACTISLSEFNFLAGTNLEGNFTLHMRTDQNGFSSDIFTCTKNQAQCINIQGNDGGDPRPPNALGSTSIDISSLNDVTGTRCFRLYVSDSDFDENIKVINFNDVEILCDVECIETVIDLSPDTATNVIVTDHTVTATIESDGVPDEGILVDFEVISGPNGGESSDPDTGECSPDDCSTDSNGQVSWTYTGSNDIGTDTIVASFFNENTQMEQESNTVEKIWVLPPRNIPTLSEWGLIAMVGLLAIIGIMALRRKKASA